MKYQSIEEMRSLRDSMLFTDRKEKHTGGSSFFKKVILCFQNLF